MEKKKNVACSVRRILNAKASLAGQPRGSGDGNDHDQSRKQIAIVLVSSRSELGATFEALLKS